MLCPTVLSSLTAPSKLAAGNVTGLISESPKVPVGFVQNHYHSLLCTHFLLLKHSETLAVFAALLFISILLRLDSYPFPPSMSCEHLAVAAS